MNDHRPSVWTVFAPEILSHLTAEDDPAIWEIALNIIFADANVLCLESNQPIVTEVGACSHWLRPHQTRWTADGGFAWPTGYGSSGQSRLGVPEFDWSVSFRWNSTSASWDANDDGVRHGGLFFRVTLPTRTTLHLQAAIHTLWTPGSPVSPKRPLLQFYGFRKKAGWVCTAYRGDERVYERAGVSPLLKDRQP